MARLPFALLLAAAVAVAQDVDYDCSKPPAPTGTSCCSAPAEVNSLGKTANETEEIQVKCRNAHIPVDKNFTKEEMNTAVECFMECAMEAAGLLTEDKKLNPAAFVALVPATSVWKDVLEKTMSICIELVESQVKETSKCKSGSYGIINCIGREMFLNCPEDNWNTSPECSDMKKYIDKCSSDLPPQL